MSLRPAHRARRLWRTLTRRRITPEDRRWVESLLSGPELRVFDRMSGADRAHSVDVARLVEQELDRLGVEAEQRRWVLVAALTHDVGKQVAGLGAYGRVVATLSEALGGSGMAEVWSERSGMTRRVGLHLRYPRLGADLLAMAGSDGRVVAWAAEHHEPEERWSVPVELGRVLRDADDRA